MSLPTPLPLVAARTLALHTQRLTTPNGSEPDPTPDAITDLAETLLYVQIDTLQMVNRAQYVTLWSRLGSYDIAAFDRMIYDPDQRRLFEYWGHAASIIPLSAYRYRLGTMGWYKNGHGWRGQWAQEPDNQALIAQVLDHIHAEGAVNTSDLGHLHDENHSGGTWWNWKPVKQALEVLYNQGDLMIADRVNFQRVYDLRERVLPDWVDTTLPDPDATRRHLIERGARALGIGELRDLADYHHWKRGDAAPVVADLVSDGTLIEIEAEQADGDPRPMFVHRDHLATLEQILGGAIIPARTTFLNPFDNVLWSKDRVAALWGFRQKLEAYTPAKDRVWGYYCLPILWKNRLIGRFDPKLERKTRTLRIKAIYLEAGIDPAEELIADVADAMRDFMVWHGAVDLVTERSDPAAFGERLRAALA
jgi:uncharacterized protein YcaQ